MKEVLIIGFIILAIILWFWAIMDIVKSRFKNQNMSVIWLLVVLLLPVLGSIIYFQFKKIVLIKKVREFQPNFNKKK